MGNHSSRKNRGAGYKSSRNTARSIDSGDELKEPPMDSYDKLVAWLVEMAENDNSDIDTSTFVNQIQNVCSQKKNKAKNHPWHQHSASCDSYGSTDTPAFSRSSKSFDDIIDSKSRLRVPGISSRQTTFSEDEDNELRKVSTESVCNESDREQNFAMDLVDPKEILLKKRKDFHASGRAAHVFSSSVGDLLDKPFPLTNGHKRKSASMVLMQAQRQYSQMLESEQQMVSPKEEPEEKILDDQLLDGNIADILFSVEALWPKK